MLATRGMTVPEVEAGCFGEAVVGAAVAGALAEAGGVGTSWRAMRRDAAKDPAEISVVSVGRLFDAAGTGVAVPGISTSGGVATPTPTAEGGTPGLAGVSIGTEGVWPS